MNEGLTSQFTASKQAHTCQEGSHYHRPICIFSTVFSWLSEQVLFPLKIFMSDVKDLNPAALTLPKYVLLIYKKF